jgi:hypothetical protein
MRLLVMMLALPWPVMAMISAGLFWAAKDTYQRVTAHEAEKAQALQAGVPAPVALDEFTETDVHPVDEVHVTAWINADHNYELTKERKGPDTVRRMYVLFGPGDGPDSKVARGVVVLHPDRVKDFIDLLAANVADPADPRFLFHLNGARDETPDLSAMVDEALAERDLMKDADFLAVEPYLDGRAVALAPDPEAAERNRSVFMVLGVLAGLLALGKFWARRRVQSAPSGAANARGPVSGGFPMQTPEPMAAGQAVQGYGAHSAPMTGAWSPIEAVKAKQMAMGGAMPRPQPSVWATAEAKPARSRVGLGAAVRTARNLLLAAIILGGMYVAFGTPGGQLPLGAMITGMDLPEGGADPFAVGPERAQPEQPAALEGQAGMAAGGEAAEVAGPTVPMPQGIAGAEQPLPQVGDTPPGPKDQVQEDIAAGMSPAEAIRKAITAEFPDETGPEGPVFLSTAKDEPVAEAGVMARVRDMLPQGWGGITPAEVSASVTGGGLWKGPAGIAVLLALGSVLATIGLALARRSRRRAAATLGDPWTRISDRLQ